MKKTVLFFSIFFTYLFNTNGQINNEDGYRPSEIALAKQKSEHCFINNSSELKLDMQGTFIYSSFNKTSSTGDFINYENNEYFIKTITASDIEDNVVIRVHYFLTEANADFLYIYDGPTENSPLLAKLSGNLLHNTNYKSSGNAITLKFVSNTINTDIGFKLYVFPQSSDPVKQLAQKKSLSCNSIPASDECIDAPLICNFNDYCGTTSGGYSAGNTSGLGNFCGSIENNSWLSFVANAPNLSFVVKSGGCQENSAGIQIVLLETFDCNTFTQISNCESQGNGSGTFTITNTVPLQIGNTYYMMIDGFGGNICSYTITTATENVGGVVIKSTYSEICPTYTTVLTSSSLSSTYAWSDNFGNTYPNQQSIVVSPTVTTTYSLITDPTSCGSNNTSKTITVSNTLTTPPIYIPAIICANQTVTLSTLAYGYNYAWSGPNGFVSSLKNPVIPNFNVTNNGTYSLVVSIDNGCISNTGVKNVNVTSSPTVSLVASQTVLCHLSSAQLIASGSSILNGYIWNWNTNDASVITEYCLSLPFGGGQCNPSPFPISGQGAGANATITPNVATTTVCVLATDASGCISPSVCINITTINTATINLFGNTNICSGDTTLISATGTSPFIWSIPANESSLFLSPDGDSLQVSPNSTSTYTISSFEGTSCSNIQFITVTVDPLCGIVTNVSELNNETDVKLSPNPTEDLLTIKSEIDFEKIELSNIAGHILLSETINTKEYQLHLQNFAEGIYFVKLSYANGLTSTKKVVKE